MSIQHTDPNNPEAIRPAPASAVPPPSFGSNLGAPATGLSNLGDLAQKAREKPLRQARGWLIFVGVVSVLVHLFGLVNLPNEVKGELPMTGLTVQGARDAETAMYVFGVVVYGGGVFLGVAYLVLASIMLKYPVAASIASMTLFILSQIVFALLNPMSLVSGFIVKIIVFVVLINAIKAAFVFEREKRQAAEYQVGFGG